MTKESFREATRLRNIWNKSVVWNNYHLATVLWHEKPWKHIANDATWEDVSERSYTPIAEFKTQEELWQHLKSS